MIIPLSSKNKHTEHVPNGFISIGDSTSSKNYIVKNKICDASSTDGHMNQTKDEDRNGDIIILSEYENVAFEQY